MRVRCIKNEIASLRTDPALAEAITHVYPRREEPLDLQLDAEYVVFAIAHQYGVDWYYVFNDPEDSYPRWFPAKLFEVVDPARFSDWLVLPETRDDGLREAPRVWANTPNFYERLVDEDNDVLIAFRALRLAVESADRRSR